MSLVKFDVTRISPKWTLNSSGNLQSGSDNLPGFEFNADGSYKGVLVEPASTNDITYSEDFRNTAQAGETRPWIYSNLSFNSNETIAPDGNQTADEIIPNTTNGVHQLRRALTPLDGTYTLSVFAKQNGYKNLLLWADGISGGVGVNLDDLSVFRDENNDGYTIKQYPNGWVYISVTVTISNTNVTWSVYIYNNDPTPTLSFAGDNTNGIFIWGAQIEEGDKASSYIKTTTTTETRNEDVITLTSASQYLPNEGKVTLGWEQREDDTIYIGALSASVASGSRELVYEYSSTEQTLSIDGTEVQTITGEFDFSNMNEIQLGHVNGIDQPNTHLKYFAVE